MSYAHDCGAGGQRIEMTKEWCMKMAELEGDSEISAGAALRRICTCVPEATCPVHGIGAALDGDPNAGKRSPLNDASRPHGYGTSAPAREMVAMELYRQHGGLAKVDFWSDMVPLATRNYYRTRADRILDLLRSCPADNAAGVQCAPDAEVQRLLEDGQKLLGRVSRDSDGVLIEALLNRLDEMWGERDHYREVSESNGRQLQEAYAELAALRGSHDAKSGEQHQAKAIEMLERLSKALTDISDTMYCGNLDFAGRCYQVESILAQLAVEGYNAPPPHMDQRQMGRPVPRARTPNDFESQATEDK